MMKYVVNFKQGSGRQLIYLAHDAHYFLMHAVFFLPFIHIWCFETTENDVVSKAKIAVLQETGRGVSNPF